MRILLTVFLIFQTVLHGQQKDFNLIDYEKADNIANKLEGASLKNLPLLTYNLTNDLKTDVEKFRAIYVWVCTNIENDYVSYIRTKNKRKKIKKNNASFLVWNKSYTPKMFQRLVKDKKTACTGYAYLIKEMANLADLPCEIVNGFGRVLNADLNIKSVPNHSWNAIQLQQKWYLCDATWSAGTFIINEDIPVFKKNYAEGYFLTSPELFKRNHYPIDKKWLLSDPNYKFEDFLAEPLLYKDAFEFSTYPITPNKMNISLNKESAFEMIVQSEKKIVKKMFQFIFNDGNKSKTIIPEVEVIKNGYLLRHQFQFKGTYDLHLNLNKKPLATYVINVTK